MSETLKQLSHKNRMAILEGFIVEISGFVKFGMRKNDEQDNI